MSFFDEPNEDAFTIAPEAAATGPRVGFLDAFETAYNTQVRGSAMFGIEKAMFELEAEQVSRLREAGVEDIPHLAEGAFGLFGSGSFDGDYMDAARFYETGGDPEVAQRLEQYDRKVEELRGRFPGLGLRTSRDMWDQVRETARAYEQRAANERTTFGGAAGSLAGGMAGALSIESDPLNFATIPLGTFGKTVLARIVGQGGAQGFIEGINQITGVQEQRRLLGLESGFADGLTRVGGAVVGGALLQGVGEGVVAGARRFFRNTPSDPAPPYDPGPRPERVGDRPAQDVPEGVIPDDPDLAATKLVSRPGSYMEYIQEVSPWSTSRTGKARTVLDIENVKAQLDDWNGPDAAFTKPKTDTMITLPRSEFVAPQGSVFERVAEKSQVDDIARQVDPEAFRVYDKLATENETYRRWLRELAPVRDANVEAKLADVNNRITELQEKIARSGAMKSKKYKKEIEALTVEREAAKAEMLRQDSPDMARVRQKLMRNDEKMREMAPVVSRAYARAKGKWDNTAKDRQAIKQMIIDGRKNVGATLEDPFPTLAKSLYDKAPILQQVAKVEALLPANADAADIAMKIIAENKKQIDDVLERYRASVKGLLADENVKEISVDGVQTKLSMSDKLTLVDEAGTREVSIRQLLQEQDELEADLRAVSSCSIR